QAGGGAPGARAGASHTAIGRRARVLTCETVGTCEERRRTRVMATKKIRVYELARELGVENAAVLDLANELKIGVKSHSSSIDDPSADRVRRLAGVRSRRPPAPVRSRPPVLPVVARPVPAAPRPARLAAAPVVAAAEAASRAVVPVALPAGRPVVEAGTRAAAVPVPRASGLG